jgi:isopentenyl diphosphate isomerase/L-lactate dehydrogenase-like FMN-dependent dehydrogenase
MTSEFLKRHGHSVAAMRLLARRRLPRLVFDFIDGGAEDERALRRNEEALGQTRLLPRPLNGTEQRDQSIELFGQRLSMPVLIGPTGLAGMVWPRGEVHSARAARAADTIYVMSPCVDRFHGRSGARSQRQAVDAGVRVSRPGPHAVFRRARACGRV